MIYEWHAFEQLEYRHWYLL